MIFKNGNFSEPTPEFYSCNYMKEILFCNCLIGVLILLSVINTAFAQDNSINKNALDEKLKPWGLGRLKFKGGDNADWASPDFDDSDWIHLQPSGLDQPIPDSLWQGYGWFRLTFEADSNMYNRIWNLYFYTWGAAEVYIDGSLFNSYGKFSSNSGEEVRYLPENKSDLPFVLSPKDQHVLAVRFSYHKGPAYKRIMGVYSGYFGFGIGLRNEESNLHFQSVRDNFLRTFYIATSMMLVIFFSGLSDLPSSPGTLKLLRGTYHFYLFTAFFMCLFYMVFRVG